MKRIILILTLIIIFCQKWVLAQEKPWTMEECISYAITNNIGLQRQRLVTQTAEANYLKAKMDLLPSLNMGSDAAVGFGRSIDPTTNLITFEQNLSNSYSLNTNIRLFNGFATMNTIAANKFMLKAGLEAEKVTRNTLIVDVLGQYYQAIYAKGLERAAAMQLDLSDKQLVRIMKMVETGKEALSKQYEIESQVSADKLAYTIAHNNSNQALTTLKQMLQIDPSSYFEILMPDLNYLLLTNDLYNTDSIYSIAAQSLPRLKAIDFELQATKKQIAVARGNLVPSVSVGGAIFTGYYKVISETATDQVSYADQLRNNNSQAVFLSLNIPIFNNYSTGRNIKMAKIRKNDAELRLELEKNNLYTEIENACLDYNRGRDEYSAANSNLEFNMKSFTAVEKKFESGLVDVTDYSAAKTKLFSADTNVLRTKLQLLIRRLTIQFYTTGEYANLYME